MTNRGRDGLSFGPFKLVASERLLTRDGLPVDVGGRALDILITLISTPNEIVTKKDLMSRVWPDVVVEDGSLRFHIGSLRKALGDGNNGARYITTVAGRGYCFVAPISETSGLREQVPAVAVSFPHANLPSRLGRMIGRDEDVLRLSTQLIASRFVTIVGAGGVGKTTVAVAVGHRLNEAFREAVLFVDLGMLSDPGLVTTTVASLLGLSVTSTDARPVVMTYLRDKRILLVLDTCEHLVEAVAAFAESVISTAPQVHILATSREALRIDREYIYRLDALACPPEDSKPTAAVVRTFPATQLFVERAAAGGAQLNFSDADAPIVANICRKLDGVPLAIELAARRVEPHGLQQIAELLDRRLTLLWVGTRTAPPRHKTLQATLDWSFGLLSELERTVLRRLAVFVGHFTIDAALEVITNAALDRAAVFGAIESVVAKSMVATRPVGAMIRYRLLDTTRAYALDIKLDATEAAELAARHAAYYRRWLQQIGSEWSTLSTGLERVPHFAALSNVRAALEWCFGGEGNTKIGIELAAAATPVFLAMSLLPECERWADRAICALDDAARESNEEMHLQASRGMSLMFTHGESDAAHSALSRGLAIADAHRDGPNQVRLLGLLQLFHMRRGNFKTALKYGERGLEVAQAIGHPSAIADAHSDLGASLYLVGDLNRARAELEAALQHQTTPHQANTVYAGFDQGSRAAINLARTLWFQGHSAQAIERARQTIIHAESLNHPVTLSIALVWAISVFLWAGDLGSAQACTDRFIAHAEAHSLGPYLTVGRGYQSVLAIRRGDLNSGIRGLQSALAALHAAHYELITTEFNIRLADGFASAGQYADALALIEETIELVETNGDNCYMPELLRIKGSLLLVGPHSNCDEADANFTRSLELSRSQGARAWELRTATDLAGLWAGRGRLKEAHDLLQPILEQFAEGTDTADLRAAKHLLNAVS